MVDTAKAREQLQNLRTWRNQWEGLGIVPPQVDELLTMIDTDNLAVKNLVAEKAALQSEIVGLREALARDRQAARDTLQREYDTEKTNLESSLKTLRIDEGLAHKKYLETEKLLKEIEAKYGDRVKAIEADITEKEEQLKRLTEGLEKFRKEHGL